MGVDGGVTGCAGQVLVLPVWDMKMCLRVSELLCETEIDDIDLIATLADPHKNMSGFMSQWMKLREWIYLMREI